MKEQKLSAWLFLGGLLCFIFLTTVFAASMPAPTTTGGEASALELLAQEGGQITSVVSDGAYLYANSGPRLAVLTAEPNPQLTGRSAILPDNVQNVAVSGQTAVVTTYDELFTIAIGDPSQPTVRGMFQLDHGVQSVLTAGSLVYAVGGSEITMVDISDPAQPQLAGTVEPPPAWGYSITAAAVAGDLLLFREEYEYCPPHGGCDIDRRLVLTDVSSPDEPVILAEVLLAETRFIGVQLLLEGGFAFVFEETSLRVLDVNDPANPTWVAATSLPARAGTTPVVDDGIMIILAEDELTLVDVSTPTAPTLLAEIALPVRGRDLALAGDLVAVAGGCGLSLIDPLNASQPLQGTYVTLQPGGQYDSGAMLVDNDILYSGTGKFNFGAAGYCLQTVAVDDATAPTLLWSRAFDAPIVDLQKEENLLYVAAAGTLYIFDVAQPSDPTLLSITPAGDFAGYWTFDVAGEYVYICVNEGCRPAVLFLDVSDPLAPEWLGEYPVPDPTSDYAIAATPGTLFLLKSHADVEDAVELIIVDVRDPASPSLLGTLPLTSSGWVRELVVDFPNLYIYHGETLTIVDIMDPGNPHHTATLSVSGNTPAFADGILYLFDYSKATIYAYPPIAPFPFMTTAALGWGEVETAAASQDFLVTAGVRTGLLVYRFTLPEIQAAFFPSVEK